MNPLSRPLALGLLLLPGALTAQSAGFVTRLGTDTVSVERWDRKPNRIDGILVHRAPRTTAIKYTMLFRADGRLQRYEETALRSDGSPDPGATTQRMEFTADSVTRYLVQDGAPVAVRAAAPAGTVPASGSVLATELLLAAARGSGGVAWMMSVQPEHAAPWKQTFRLIGTDSAETTGPFRYGYRLNAEGRVLRTDGTRTTLKNVGTLIDAPDVLKIARGWAAEDAAGRMVGAASTRDTLRASVGAAALTIDYGRPAKRGREIWGTLVPFDTTWRFGADAATQLTLDRDVLFADIKVPAGKYSLFLSPTASGGWLIVNSATGQWGTQYNPRRDVFRIPLQRVEGLATVEERLRLSVTEESLLIHWDRGGYRVGVRAAP